MSVDLAVVLFMMLMFAAVL